MYVQPEVISLPYFSDSILVRKLELTILAQLPGQRAPRVLLSPSVNARLQGPGFICGTQDPSSGPHASFASTLTTEPPPQPYKPVQRWTTHWLHWVFFLSDNQTCASQKYLSVYTFYICHDWYHNSVFTCSISPGTAGLLQRRLLTLRSVLL